MHSLSWPVRGPFISGNCKRALGQGGAVEWEGGGGNKEGPPHLAAMRLLDALEAAGGWLVEWGEGTRRGAPGRHAIALCT